MERIVWRGRLRPWNLVIYRIGATMYRDPALTVQAPYLNSSRFSTAFVNGRT